MTQFSFGWILSLNRLSHFWGQVQRDQDAAEYATLLGELTSAANRLDSISTNLETVSENLAAVSTNLSEVSSTLNRSVTENQKAFTTTMQEMKGLTTLSMDSLRLMTGGDSYAYLDFIPPLNERAGIPKIVLVGDTPLPSLTVKIFDWDVPDEDSKDKLMAQDRMLFSNLYFHEVWTDPTKSIEFNDHAKLFEIRFETPFNSWKQTIRLKWVLHPTLNLGGWALEYTVGRGSENLMHCFNENYPNALPYPFGRDPMKCTGKGW